jgi:hypothetical protein
VGFAVAAIVYRALSGSERATLVAKARHVGRAGT